MNSTSVLKGRPAALMTMPMHTITEVYGEQGLRDRWELETSRLPSADRRELAEALSWASELHAGQRRIREPYINHVLRVAIRIVCYYRVRTVEVLVAALLHDTVEDQSWSMAGIPPQDEPPPRPQAVAALTERFGATVATLVTALTNPVYDPDRDKHQQYRDHIVAALTAEPLARLVKFSDFTDNGVGVLYTPEPKLQYCARKYRPVVPLLHTLLALPDTPIPRDVKDHIAAQFDLASRRFTAVLAD